MKIIAALPVLIAFLVGASPAHAWTWPVSGPVLRSFSFGDDPFAAGHHRGLDVGAPPGTTVVAPAGGVVTFSGAIPRSGRCVTIATEDGYSVTLVHLGSYTVDRGATVGEGDPVGTIGPSGEPEHPQGYVHLGVRVTANEHGYVDPMALLPGAPGPGGGAGEGEAEGPAEVSEPRGSGEEVDSSSGEPAHDPPGERSQEERKPPAEAEHAPPSASEGSMAKDGAEGLPESRADAVTGAEHFPGAAPVSLAAPASSHGKVRSYGEPPAGGVAARSRRPSAVGARSTDSSGGAEGPSAGWAGAAQPRASVGRRHEELGAGVGTAVAGSALAVLTLAAAATALGRFRRRRRIKGVQARLLTGDRVATTASEHLASEPGDSLAAELEAWLAGVLGPKSACVIPPARSGGSRTTRRPRSGSRPGAAPTRPTRAQRRAERYARAG